MQQIWPGSTESPKAEIVMSTPMNGETRQSTAADQALTKPPPLAHAADRPVMVVNTDGVVQTPSEKTVAPLFTQHAAANFRSRWDVVQRGFVDSPEQAVRAADELVAQVIKSLSESFSAQRSAFEVAMNQQDRSSTENRRLALQRYGSFLERLLSI